TLEKAGERLIKSEAAYRQLKIVYDEEQAREAEREKKKTTVERYRELLPVLESVEETKKEMATRQKNMKEQSKVLHTLEKDQEVDESSLKAIITRIEKIEEQVSKQAELQQKRYDLRLTYKVLEDYMQLEKECQTLEKEYVSAKKLYEKAKQTFALTEAAWLSNQAAVMAVRLQMGDSCPVCGSEHHPNKAHNKD